MKTGTLVLKSRRTNYGTRPIIYRIEKNGCWTCISHSPSKRGYLQVRVNGKLWLVSRLIYTNLFGVIPEGKVIRHTCDNPACINPKHLIIGTQADNLRDMVKRKRSPRGMRNHNTKLTKQEVIEIRESTENQYVLAERYDVSQGYISGIQKGHERKYVKGKLQKKDKRKDLAKVSDNDVREIRKSSKTCTALSQEFGISLAQVARIRRRERRKDVQD